MSPENLRERLFSEKSDVWSYGILLYELVVGHEPYSGEGLLEIAFAIRDNGRNPLGEFPKDRKPPKYIKKVMKRCFKIDPTERASFAEIVTMLEGSRPSGYSSAPDENEENLLGISSNRKTTKRRNTKRITVDERPASSEPKVAVEMEEPTKATNYVAIDGKAE